jgi:predicted nucleic acid-binding protein
MMMLIDTSAWIEYFRKTGSSANVAVKHAIRDGSAATTDMVLLEILAGTTDPARLAAWERLMGRCEFFPQEVRADAEVAARLYRECRRAGDTPRMLTDCLIAAVAVRNGLTVLHRDRDFEVIARHTDLQVVTA